MKNGPKRRPGSSLTQWYKDDRLHREDGPAVEWDSEAPIRGTNLWYVNGQWQRRIPYHVLINYMQANGYTLAHLLTDPDPLVRHSAATVAEGLKERMLMMRRQ